MRKIGVIGGLSWVSTADYYRRLNLVTQERLGCTEIPLLVRPGDTDPPTFSTTEIHCWAAVEMALASGA